MDLAEASIGKVQEKKKKKQRRYLGGGMVVKSESNIDKWSPGLD